MQSAPERSRPGGGRVNEQRHPVRVILIIAVTAIATAALGALGRASYDPPNSGAGSIVRLSWRLRGEKTESCRQRTAEELAALPAHMRTPAICDVTLVSYRLVVQLDDERPDTSGVVPGGARGDRPVFVMRDIIVAPGPHRVRITFERADLPVVAAMTRLAIDTHIVSEQGAVDLITFDGDTHRLVHRAPTSKTPEAAK